MSSINFQGMDEADLTKAVQGGFAFVTATPTEMLDNDASRRQVVNRFGVSLGAYSELTKKGKLDNATMKQLFNPKFIKQYNKIAGFEDEASAQMAAAVGSIFAETLNNKRVQIERDLNTHDLVGLRFDYQGGNITLSFDTDNPSLTPSAKKMLRESGSTDVFEIHKYYKTRRRTSQTKGINQIARNVERLNNMNEIVRLNRQFTNLKDPLEESLRDNYTAQASPTFVNEITGQADLEALPSGAVFVFRQEDGSVITGVKP